jgi:hypothetical protein
LDNFLHHSSLHNHCLHHSGIVAGHIFRRALPFLRLDFYIWIRLPGSSGAESRKFWKYKFCLNIFFTFFQWIWNLGCFKFWLFLLYSVLKKNHHYRVPSNSTHWVEFEFSHWKVIKCFGLFNILERIFEFYSRE